MKTSQVGIALIKGFEGFSAKPYLCPAAKNTVGYGHVVLPGELFDEVTEAQAETILAGDLSFAEEAVEELVKAPLRQCQFDALVSLVFNIGETAFAKSTLLKLLNAENYAAAGTEFRKWVYGGGNRIPGLVRRREAELNLFRGQ